MNQLKRSFDDWLGSFTMYQFVLYGLGMLVVVACILSVAGSITLPLGGLLLSLTILVVGCYLANRVLGRLYGVPVNRESALITALILFCILPPATNFARVSVLLMAALIAMASKYVLAWQGRHLFNPAALAAVVIGFTGIGGATWWIGSGAMLPFMLLLGVLVLRKLGRFGLVGCFVVASLAALAVAAWTQGQPVGAFWRTAVVSGPLIFLGIIMLTEPATLPSGRVFQWAYAVLVGLLFGAQLRVDTLFITPEFALIAGNIYAFMVSPKRRWQMRLVDIRELAPGLYDFSFVPASVVRFMPGQYLEWTLPLKLGDARGNRRTFTIASSPTERSIHIGIKLPVHASAFKRTLLGMKPGAVVYAGQLGGEFCLPQDTAAKLVWVAGGIGITPFRSMIKYLIDTGQRRDVVLIYAARNLDDWVYTDLLEEAKAVGVRTIKVQGRLTAKLITHRVRDYDERMFYIAGSSAMVANSRHIVRGLGIRRRRIITDDFTGY